MEHSIFSASASFKWLNCPASLSMEKDIPNQSNKYAEEGTKAHKVAETLLRDPYSVLSLDCEEEMLNHVKGYVDYIEKIKKSNEDCEFLIEQRVNYNNVAQGGFGTVDCILFSKKEFHIVDLKYGKNVVVDVEENSQLMLYLIGSLNLNEIKEYYGDNFNYEELKFYIHIYQPRANNIVSSETTYKEIRKKIIEYGIKAKDCLEENPHFVPGKKQCKFCRFKPKCEEYKKNNLENKPKLPDDFLDNLDDLVESIKKFEEVDKLSEEKIVFFLDNKKNIENYLLEIEDKAFKRLKEGLSVGNYTIGKGRTMRSWNDKAEKVLNLELPEEEIYVKKLKTISVIEKIIGKEKLENLEITEVSQPKEILVKSK